MPMSREIIRTSTIFIATRGHTRVYHNLGDVPPSLRQKLIRSTGGREAGTVVIADRRGAEELLRMRAPIGPSGINRWGGTTIRWARRHWLGITFGLTLALFIRVLFLIWS
jgi:hypothetical protein